MHNFVKTIPMSRLKLVLIMD